MITYLLEKQYVDSKGNPTTEWEPCGHSPLRDGKINSSHQELIDTNPHKDGLGHTLPNGGASFLYNFRHVAYERIDEESEPFGPTWVAGQIEMNERGFGRKS